MKLRPIDNPPNPYLTEHAEWLEPPPLAKLQVYEETARSILSRNESPDLPFNWSLNPYRGCQHACAYCYARPYHEYLGYGAGTDFDTKLVAKINAPVLLRETLKRHSWAGESIMFSGATDCYQPLEASYRLTRRCLEVCLDLDQQVSIVTKAFLVVRDAELLAELNRRAGVLVYLSIPFADAKTCAKIEPQAPPPKRRFEAIRQLAEAGVPVGVFISPVIPGLNEHEIPRILEQAAEAGASGAALTALRLSGSVEDVFLSRLRAELPLRADRVISKLRDIRGGNLNDARFGHRMRGSGVYWNTIVELFNISRDRLGLVDSRTFRLESGSQPHRPQTPRRESAEQLTFRYEGD